MQQTTPKMSARGHNPQLAMANWEKAMELRLKGATIRKIARVMGRERTGAQAGQPYSPGTVHGWLQRGTQELAPIREETAQELRRVELARLDGLLLNLSSKLAKGDTKAVTVALGISRRRAKLLGLDEPAELLVMNRTDEALTEYSRIIRQGILDCLPLADANRVLNFLEARVCEAVGEPPPPIEATAIDVTPEADKPDEATN